MWCEAWNTIVNTDDGYAKINVSESSYDYGYKYKGTSKEDDYMFMNGTTLQLSSDKLNKLQEDDMYSLFFPHTTNSEITANGKAGECCGYWLASPSALSYSRPPAWCLKLVYYSGLVGNSFTDYDNQGVRPIVCLTSSIRLTESGITEKGKAVYNIGL